MSSRVIILFLLVSLQSPEIVSAVGKLSYNQLVEKIIDYKHSTDSNRVSEGDLSPLNPDPNPSDPALILTPLGLSPNPTVTPDPSL